MILRQMRGAILCLVVASRNREIIHNSIHNHLPITGTVYGKVHHKQLLLADAKKGIHVLV
jgi:hypothetical protein